MCTARHFPSGPGYLTPYAERIRREAGIPTGTVGFITSAQQADHIIRNGQADLVILARQLLRDPYWPLHAAAELHAEAPWPLAVPAGKAVRHRALSIALPESRYSLRRSL